MVDGSSNMINWHVFIWFELLEKKLYQNSLAFDIHTHIFTTVCNTDFECIE